MEALYLRNLDQMFWIWSYVKLQTKAHFMLILKNKTISPVIYMFYIYIVIVICTYHYMHCLSWEFQVLNIYENQVGFIEALKFGLSNLILVSEVWV